jgi:hypothetical protein
VTTSWMSVWRYFLWSLEFLYARPFVYGTVLLVANFVASVIALRPFRQSIWKRTYPIIIFQFVFFPATLFVAAVGTVDWQRVPFPGPNHWGLRTEDAFAVGSLIVAAYWIYRMKRLRWFAVSSEMLQICFLVAANFIAGMALTGTWL